MIEQRLLRDKYISYAVALHITIITCKNILASTNAYLYSINDKLNILVLMIVAIIYMFLIFKLNFNIGINKRTYIILILSIIFWGFSYLFDNSLFSYPYVQSALITFFAYCLPYLLFVSQIKNYKYLLDNMYKYSYVMVAFVILGYLFFINSDQEYSQSFGYTALITFEFVYSKYFKKKKIIDLILAIICGIIIILSGSRGPFFCMCIVLILQIYRNINNSKTRKLIVVSMILFLPLLLTFGNTIIINLVDILEKYNINSRTLIFIEIGMLTNDTGRSLYTEELLKLINKSPIFGLGAFGANKTVGLAHNFLIDCFANFGYFIGSIILILFFYKLFFTYINNKNELGELLFIYSTMFLPILFFSESFWSCDDFWMIIALIISRETYKKRKKNIVNSV